MQSSVDQCRASCKNQLSGVLEKSKWFLKKINKKRALIKKRGKTAFTRGFAAAQRTRFPRVHAVFVFNFLHIIFRVFLMF
jgi:hypothetical protein